MNNRVIIIFLMAVIHIRMVFAQVPDLPDQTADSVAYTGEYLSEQRSVDDDITDSESIHDIDFSISLRSRILHRMQRAAGYLNGYYSGSSDKIYERLFYQIGKHISGGCLMEKDAGERNISSFTTLNVAFTEVCPFVKKLVFGDYRVESGQGLTIWSGRGYAKGADVITPTRRKPRGIISTISSDEFRFLRGIGAEFLWKSFTALIFLSSMRRSASLDKGGNIISFNESGYYRTARELDQQNNTGEQSVGSRFTFKFLSRHGFIGVTYLGKKYSRHFSAGGQLQRMSGTAFDFSCNLGQTSVFGEYARANDRSALIGGILLNPQKKIKIVISYRQYPLGNQLMQTLPFGEWGAGERGFYFGLTALIRKWLDMSLYFDQFEKLESGEFSCGGNDLLVNIRIPILPKLIVTAQYRRKTMEYASHSNNPGMLPERSGNLNYRQKFRLNLDYIVLPSISLRGRFEKNFYSDGNGANSERGFLFYHDITINYKKNWLFCVRVSYFSSLSPETAPYELERDLEGILTQTLLSGEGIRFYILAGYDATTWLKMAVKYSFMRRDDVLKIGNGYDQLPSNIDPRLSVQIDVSLK